MDLLSEILSSAGWKHDLLAKEHIYDQFGFHFPCDRSGGFHIVTQGACYAKIGTELLSLQKGDLLFITRGVHHELLSHPQAKVVTIERFLSNPDIRKPNPEGKPVTTFVSVRYEVPPGPIHPLFWELPDYIHIPFAKIQTHHALSQILSVLSLELELNLGSDLIVQRCTDILLYYLIRMWIESQSVPPAGWLKAMQDSTILYALEKMHNRYNFDWTIESLAKEMGVSRAHLASRFKEILGIPPMEYLTKLRMDKATAFYRLGGMNLEEIALKVGYASAFSFSKAFKRIYGTSPAKEWKQVG